MSEEGGRRRALFSGGEDEGLLERRRPPSAESGKIGVGKGTSLSCLHLRFQYTHCKGTKQGAGIPDD